MHPTPQFPAAHQRIGRTSLLLLTAAACMSPCLGITADLPQLVGDGIEAIGTMQLTITRTHIRSCRHAVHLVENNRNVTISDCHFYENAGCGVLYDNVNLHQSNINGCHISYNAGGDGNTAEANNSVVIRGCEDCAISGLHISNVWRSPAGLLLEECRRIHLSDSTVLDCDTRGVWRKNVSQSYVHDLFVRDDRQGSTSVSLRETGGDGLTLRNNVLQHPPQETGVGQP